MKSLRPVSFQLCHYCTQSRTKNLSALLHCLYFQPFEFKQQLPHIPVPTYMLSVPNTESQGSFDLSRSTTDHMCKKCMLPQRECLAVQS